MKTLRFVMLLAIAGWGMTLSGCGGGSGANSTTAKTGGARFTIKWPPPSRLIPAGAYSIRIALTVSGQTIAPQLATRPTGTDTSTTTFNNVPVGNVAVNAIAYPNPDGTGNPQASGVVVVKVPAGSIVDSSLALNSAIQKVSLTPTTTSLGINSSQVYAVSALDSAGAVVLTGGANWRWSSDNPSVAALTVNGAMATVQGVAPGTATLHVQEVESTQSSQLTITVTQAQIALTPTSVTLTPGGTQLFSAAVQNAGSQAVTWSVVEGAAGGTITTGGLYRAPSTQGVYHVQAVSPTQPGLNATSVVVVSSAPGAGGSSVFLAASGWPKFGGDAQNTWRSAGRVATNGVGTRWSFESGGPSLSQQCSLGMDGTAYFGTLTGKVFAVDTSGAQKWLFSANTKEIPGSPAVSADGTVYVGSADGNLYALDGATGTKKWAFPTGSPVLSPAIGTDGSVYFSTISGSLYAVDGATGAQKWVYATSEPSLNDAVNYRYCPALSTNGIVYANLGSGILYAVDTATGTLKWKYTPPSLPVSQFALGSNGSLYLVAGADPNNGGNYKNIIALDSVSGAQKWLTPFSNAITGLALGADNTVYTAGQSVYALDGNLGSILWKVVPDTNPVGFRGPTVDGNGMLYVSEAVNGAGPSEGILYALDPGQGITKWSFKPGSSGLNSGCIVGPDGTVYAVGVTALFSLR